MESSGHDSNVSVIVGLGTTGLSCARYLSTQNESFVVVDSRLDPPGLAQLRSEYPEVEVELGDFNEETFVNARRLIVSPGVSLNEKVIVRAREQGVPVTGDIDIFSRVATAPLVAVTGSNGKSTVVSLVAEICQQAGVRFALGGNYEGENARPALDLLEQGEQDVYILELSSFQLETTEQLGAEVAVILNFSEDHMDRYDDLEAYLQAKQRVFNGASKIVVNRDTEYSKPPVPGLAEISEFGLQEPGPGMYGTRRIDGEEWLACGDRNLLPASELKVIGQHNVSNVLAAMAITSCLGIALEDMVEAAKSFAGLPHRCQWVAERGNVNFYNDSKGTNVGATAAAIAGLGEKTPGKIVLIAGGVGKDADFSPLQPVVARYVKSVVLLGSAAAELAEVFEGVTAVLFAADMQDAVSLADKEAQFGDAVLLSPACASFDMFNNFSHRGQQFINQVRELQ